MKAFATAIFSILPLISALPQPPPENTRPVIFCTSAHYNGECDAPEFPYNECQQLTGRYLRNLGTFRVVEGNMCRITYTSDTCTQHGDVFIYPDTPSHVTLHQFNDTATGETIDLGSQITSFLCQKCTECV